MIGSFWFNSFSAGGAPAGGTDYELISTTVLGSSAASVSFSGLGTSAAAYKHLQIRMATRDASGATGSAGVWMQLNGDTAANYSWHRVGGANSVTFSNGSTSTTKMLVGLGAKSTDSAGVFGAVITDILDFSSTSKNKTVRSLTGNASSISNISMEVNLDSGAWFSTAAVTSVVISGDANFATGSRFSLYGLKG